MILNLDHELKVTVVVYVLTNSAPPRPTFSPSALKYRGINPTTHSAHRPTLSSSVSWTSALASPRSNESSRESSPHFDLTESRQSNLFLISPRAIRKEMPMDTIPAGSSNDKTETSSRREKKLTPDSPRSSEILSSSPRRKEKKSYEHSSKIRKNRNSPESQVIITSPSSPLLSTSNFSLSKPSPPQIVRSQKARKGTEKETISDEDDTEKLNSKKKDQPSKKDKKKEKETK